MKSLPESSISTATALTNRDRRNETIRTEFNRQKERGVRSAYIITDLAFRFYLEESTIESIVWKRGYYCVSACQPTILNPIQA